MFRSLRLLLVLASLSTSANAISVAENFDDITTLAGAGWLVVNDSSPVGQEWFQGDADTAFAAQSGAPNAYIAANFYSADNATGTVDLWLISPEYSLSSGDVMSFWTRTAGNLAGDQLTVYRNTGGSTPSSFLPFGPVVPIPASAGDTYPDTWTQYSDTYAGAPGSARYAFRYQIADTRDAGEYIGIDTYSVTSPVPLPAAAWLLLSGLVPLVSRVRRSIRA